MNAVAFCLYGNNPKYLEGMIRNAWLMPRIYPGWECHVWVAADVPRPTISGLIQCSCFLHQMSLGWKQRMFYRLLIHDLPGVDRYLIRDADSRISMRERRCVDEWMRSTSILHTIHDHPYHIRPIQGGMFGVWRKQFEGPAMRTLIGDVWPSVDVWGRDEEFLQAALWPLVKDSVCEHGRVNPIPSGSPNEDEQAFVGEVYDEHGNHAHPEHRAMRK